MQRVIVYHYTPTKTYREHIAHEGIACMPMGSDKEIRKAFEVCGIHPIVGFFVWPLVWDDLLRDFLLFNSQKTKQTNGTVLECSVDPNKLLSTHAALKTMTHCMTTDVESTFYKGTTVFHEHVPLDIYTIPLEPQYIEPVYNIAIEVKLL